MHPGKTKIKIGQSNIFNKKTMTKTSNPFFEKNLGSGKAEKNWDDEENGKVG